MKGKHKEAFQKCVTHLSEGLPLYITQLSQCKDIIMKAIQTLFKPENTALKWRNIFVALDDYY